MWRQSRHVLLTAMALWLLWVGGVNAQRTVSIWFYGAGSDFDVLDAVRQDFEKEKPDISVEIVNVPYTANFERWAVAVAGGAPPDASMANWGIIYQIGGAPEPLQEWAEQS